jgi:F-type H+-transporting ATPase subunit delta
MSVFRISYRYANSLLQLAEEKGILSRISEDADLIFNTLADSKELRVFLKSPVVKPDNKKSLLNEIFGKKISSESLSFLIFIIEKNRENILFEIFKELITLVDKKNGISKARITSSVEINEELRGKIIGNFARMTDKKISASFSVDPGLVGGFIVKIDDMVYDASVKHQLNLLRKKFAEEITISNN